MLDEKVPRYVYFIRAGDMMKIGCSIQPEKRLLQIGEWVPYKLEIVATMLGSFGLEAAFHAHFEESWSHMEWFHITPEMLVMIDDINAGKPIGLSGDIKNSAKHRQRCAKVNAVRRVTTAENRAGLPIYTHLREKARPQYLKDALASFAGSKNPAPSPDALDAISRYVSEIDPRERYSKIQEKSA